MHNMLGKVSGFWDLCPASSDPSLSLSPPPLNPETGFTGCTQLHLTEAKPLALLYLVTQILIPSQLLLSVGCSWALGKDTQHSYLYEAE